VITVNVVPLAESHVEDLARAFAALGWTGKDAALFRRYVAEHDAGARAALVASAGAEVAGYVTVLWDSGYLPFRQAGIPEISDLNVLPRFPPSPYRHGHDGCGRVPDRSA
jgi:hypothetical protein